MKPSINTKALVLSLSAILLVGVGCERRGRAPAPIKASTTGGVGGLVAGTGDTGSTPGVAANPTTKTTHDIDLASDETLLRNQAQMACEVTLIDETGTPDAESFKADVQLLNDFQIKCMEPNGIRLTSDAKNAQIQVLDTSAAQTELNRLFSSQADNDDVAARKVMLSRIEFSNRQFKKFGTKYGSGQLKGCDQVSDQDVTDKLTMAQKLETILTAGASHVEAMTPVKATVDTKSDTFVD